MDEQFADIWHRIIPIPIGTKVRKIKNEAILSGGARGRSEPPLLTEGEVIEYVDSDWKHSMINAGCYPPEILGETMYHVRFRIGGGYAIRGRELEVIEEQGEQ